MHLIKWVCRKCNKRYAAYLNRPCPYCNRHISDGQG